MAWITFSNVILVELPIKYYASQFSPHRTFASLPTKNVLDLKVVWCCLAIRQGEFVVLDLL
jgi:hypothetical protein